MILLMRQREFHELLWHSLEKVIQSFNACYDCRESFFAAFITPRKTIDSSLFQLYLLGFLKILSKDTPSCQRRDVV